MVDAATSLRAGRLVEIGVFAAVFAMLVVRVPPLEHFLDNADHGYGLAAGEELLHGRLPGVDSLSNYGPLVAVLGAATLSITHSLVGEAVFCAAAWAAAVWLLFRLARRNLGALPAWCVGAAAVLCIARFHKWYMWLLPLAALAATEPAEDGRRRWALGGLICGVGALLRPELGVAALCVLALLALAGSIGSAVPTWRAVWALVLSFAVAPIAWVLVVLAFGGVGGLTTALAAVPDSLVGSVEHWSKAPPPLDLGAPFSIGTSHALALKLLPATEVAAIILGGWLGWVARGPLVREGRFLVAIGLMGFAFYPHTIYRADVNHLLQGIWPLLIGVPALGVVALRYARATSGPLAWLAMASAAVLALLSLAALTPIVARPHFDLAPFGRAPLAGLRELSRGLSAATDHPYVQVVQEIERLTAPDDEVMIIPWAPQLLAFARRSSSGLSFAFQRGIFDSLYWRQQRLARLEAKPPPLVIAPWDFFQLQPDQGFRASQPEMYDFVRTHYRVIAVFGPAGMLALAPAR